MYDRATGTLWHQFLGEPVVGELADSGIKLELLPVVVTSWAEWLTAHPDTTVLDVQTGVYPAERYFAERDERSIYYGYREQPDTMFPVWQRSDLLHTKALILGITVNGEAKAYSLVRLVKEPVVNDSLGGKSLVVITVGRARSARVYERLHHSFSLAEPDKGEPAEVFLIDGQGRRWRMEEAALVLENDVEQRLARLPSHVAYWFGWYAFYPTTDVY